MSNAILFRMASGVPGDISRRGQTTVEPVIFDGSKPFSGYGLPGKTVSGKFVPLESGDAATVVDGFLARPYPIQTANADGSGVSTLKCGDRVRRGYMTVKCNAGTPAVAGQVYTRVGNPSSGKPIGGIEAASEVAAVGAATGGNTGNGTIGTVSATSAAITGVYKATMTSATAFTVQDPNGVQLKAGATGTAYTCEGATFTITVGGTPMIAGDSFTVTVTPGTVPVPGAVFMDAGDASGNVEIRYNV